GPAFDNLAFSPDGRLLASGGEWGRLRIWEVATGKCLLDRHSPPSRSHFEGMLFSLAFAPDGKTLAWGEGMAAICLWDVARGRRRHRLKTPVCGRPNFTFSPDGKLLASGVGGAVHLWDVASGKELRGTGEQPLPSSPV